MKCKLSKLSIKLEKIKRDYSSLKMKDRSDLSKDQDKMIYKHLKEIHRIEKEMDNITRLTIAGGFKNV